MKRVLFYTENNWVFGKLFNELVKYLYPEYDCDILDWGKIQPREDTDRMQQKYDLFFSTPVGCFFLHDTYGIPLTRCYGHAHSDFDVVDAVRRFPLDYFNQLCGYAVVSRPLVGISFSHGVPRIPDILPVGVTCTNYRRPPATQIKKLGYFGRMSRQDNKFDIKRGYLAQRVAEQAKLTLWHREGVHFIVADRLYHEVDIVIFCSLVEGNPYVALEAMAAGLPVLGTDVGIFSELSKAGAGVILPFHEDAFVAHAVEAIHLLQAQPELYRIMSQAAITLSQQYDWSVIKEQWLKTLRSVTE
jgi:hypothetical protein